MLAFASAIVLAGACAATYTVVGLDGGDDASASDAPNAPLSDVGAREATAPPSVDAGSDVDAADAGPCVACGAECCYTQSEKNHCRFGDTCGACSATTEACRGDVDCCDAGKCATSRNGDGGLCRATCKGRFGLCNSTNDCCLPLRCEPNGSLTLCQ